MIIACRDVEAEAVEAVRFLWKRKHFEEKKLEAEVNSEAFDFLRSRKRKHFL